jgi:hypothetical protein
MTDTIELNKETLNEMVKEFERLSQPNKETIDFYNDEKWKYLNQRLPEGAEIIIDEKELNL